MGQIMGEREPIPNHTGWGEIPLTPEIATPEKRLSAALNIAQNCAQTLTVLTMASDTRQWESYCLINTNMNRQVGLKVVNSGPTRNHLIKCIEPVGAATRSTIDDKDWALTKFGIKIKPALIFIWQKLIELNLDAMALLGNRSQGKKDEDGNFKTTPPMIRAQILLALAGHTDKGPMRVVDFFQTTKLSLSNLSGHLENLKTAGLVNFESVDPNSGQPVTFFGVTPIGHETTNWPVFREKRGATHRHKISAFVQEAVQTLSLQGRPITTDAVATFKSQNLLEFNPARPQISSVLSHFVRSCLLERGRFHEGHKAEIWLTPSGEQVVENIIEPLVAWSQNSEAVVEINQIAARLKVNPSTFADLYPKIATSFIEHSPQKNADPELKRQKITALIKVQPGQLTRADLGRELKVSRALISFIIKLLIESGEIIQTKAPRGNRLFLSPSPNLK